jgi:hypothetical protein
MEARELRIGNFISDMHASDGGYWKVWELKKETCHYGLFTYKYENLKPIPLTIEWLEKFGFKLRNKEHYGTSYYMFLKEWSIRHKIKRGKDLFSLNMYSNYVKYIEYVHQLQNLYFALTGKELTIKD